MTLAPPFSLHCSEKRASGNALVSTGQTTHNAAACVLSTARMKAQRSEMESRPAGAEPTADPVLCAHKFFAPPSVRRAIERNALQQRLQQHAEARVIVLQGPAGHGKSTALQQIKQACEAAGRITAWLSFDEADNDPRRFFPHIRALVSGLDPDAEIDPPPARSRRRSDWIIECLRRLDRPTALFLDEFQTLTAAELLRFFRELTPAGERDVVHRLAIDSGNRAVACGCRRPC